MALCVVQGLLGTPIFLTSQLFGGLAASDALLSALGDLLVAEGYSSGAEVLEDHILFVAGVCGWRALCCVFFRLNPPSPPSTR